MEKEKSCGAIVYKKNKENVEFLLVLQSCTENYSFPKGHVEENETEVETALREIKEETNLDVKIDDSFKEKTTFFVKEKNNYKDLILFLAQPISTNIIPQEGEIIDCKWYSYNKAMELLKYPDLKQILTKAFKYINANN